MTYGGPNHAQWPDLRSKLPQIRTRWPTAEYPLTMH